jgi:hypothetical protein
MAGCVTPNNSLDQSTFRQKWRAQHFSLNVDLSNMWSELGESGIFLAYPTSDST